jgi:hypothetical protein
MTELTNQRFTASPSRINVACLILLFAGTVHATTNTKLAGQLTVTDFGATGDGIADDTQAFNQAIAASSLSNCIRVPNGIYRTTAALVATHPICLTGDSWRVRYDGSDSINAVFSIVGGPASIPHAAFFEGSSLTGAVLDGNGRALNGLLLQGVVSGWMNYIRVTNVIDTGVVLNWAQQITFEHLMVSDNFERFSTVPQRGLVIDGISSANIFNAINIEHVAANGIELNYAYNTIFNGGTSEGNHGLGVRCTGAVSPYRTCVNNTFTNLDTEENSAGDYEFGDLAYFNTIVSANSFSKVGIHFTGSAVSNTVIGGLIGPSIADAGTKANRLVNVGAILSNPGVAWTDNGQNYADPIYDSFSNSIQPAVNNYSAMATKVGAGGASTGQILCRKSDSTIGSCSALGAGSTTCTCN